MWNAEQAYEVLLDKFDKVVYFDLCIAIGLPPTL